METTQQQTLWEAHEEHHSGSVQVPVADLIDSIRLFRYVEDRETAFRIVASALAQYGNSIVFYVYYKHFGFRYGYKSEEYVAIHIGEHHKFAYDASSGLFYIL